MVVCRFIMFIERGQVSDSTRMEEKYEGETLERFIWADEADPEKQTVRDEEKQSPVEEDSTLKELLRVDEEYVPLLTLLEQFCPGEDGIQFNPKLQHFENTISSMCPDEARLHQAFATLRAAALLNAETARKLAAIGVAFTRQAGQRLRIALLNVVMQETFTKLDVLKSNPVCLVNAANLMGDYFAVATLNNGKKLHYLASPLLQYLRALLSSDDVRAHRSLATQLLQNGAELFAELGEEMDEFAISIRLRLLATLPTSSIWLLLSADLCVNKFLPLPQKLQQFYAARPERATEENLRHRSYGSWIKSPRKDVTSEMAAKVSQSLSRPIAGAGAGLLPKVNLKKRLDLNSWRQQEASKHQGGGNNQKYPGGTPIAPSSTNQPPSTTPAMPILIRQEDSCTRQNGDGQLVRMTRRSSGKDEAGTPKPPRSRVTQVPRHRKYWDHDDRCDKEYDS